MPTDDMSLPRNFLRFCPHCGSAAFRAVSDKEFQCQSCGFNFFTNSAAAVVGVIADSFGRIMLTRRARDPWRGSLDLPGGFADPGEGAEEALQREMNEELGCGVENVRYLCSFPNKYVFSGYAVMTTDVAFVCSLPSDVRVCPHDDVSEVLWLSPAEIDIDAIPSHSIREIIKFYQRKL